MVLVLMSRRGLCTIEKILAWRKRAKAISHIHIYIYIYTHIYTHKSSSLRLYFSSARNSSWTPPSHGHSRVVGNCTVSFSKALCPLPGDAREVSNGLVGCLKWVDGRTFCTHRHVQLSIVSAVCLSCCRNSHPKVGITTVDGGPKFLNMVSYLWISPA